MGTTDQAMCHSVRLQKSIKPLQKMAIRIGSQAKKCFALAIISVDVE